MATITNYTYVDSAAITTDTVTSMGKLLKVNGEAIKLSVDSFDEDELKRKITQILLEDPDSEVKRMAEDYLIQCLYDATEDPENNPILQKYFGKNQEEINQLTNEIREAKNEILQIKSELQALKDKLRVNSGGYYNYYEEQGVAWKNDVQAQFGHLESKLISITKKLGKAGIDINYWED
jgi:predicted  nucleic acid-binding Zn-ribbon protein